MTSCLEAELSVLGAFLLYGPKAVEAAREEGLTYDRFWWDSHSALAKTCFELVDRGLPCDDITVVRAGVKQELVARALEFARPSSLRAHARFVVEDHGWRERFRLAEELMNAVKTKNEGAWQRLIRGDRPALRVVKDEANAA